MHTWIEIGSGQVIAFHDHAQSDLDSYLPSIRYAALLSLGNLIRPSQVSGGSSAPNISAVIENGDGRFTSLLADRIGEVVTVKRETGAIFSGILQSVSLSSETRLSVVG